MFYESVSSDHASFAVAFRPRSWLKIQNRSIGGVYNRSGLRPAKNGMSSDFSEVDPSEQTLDLILILNTFPSERLVGLLFDY